MKEMRKLDKKKHKLQKQISKVFVHLLFDRFFFYSAFVRCKVEKKTTLTFFIVFFSEYKVNFILILIQFKKTLPILLKIFLTTQTFLFSTSVTCHFICSLYAIFKKYIPLEMFTYLLLL